MKSNRALVLLKGMGLPGGLHEGPVVGMLQDGKVVCQCLACGKCWDEEGKTLMEADGVSCNGREEP